MYQDELYHAAQILKEGGVIAHATEGVWGLACDPWNEITVNRILEIKQRSIDQGLIVIGSDPSMFKEEMDSLPSMTQDKILASWPGHVTWVLPTCRFPHWVTGNRASIAARVPDHDQSRKLVTLFSAPIVSTSANVSGAEPATTMNEVVLEFASKVDFVVPGKIGSVLGPSRILDAKTENSIR